MSSIIIRGTKNFPGESEFDDLTNEAITALDVGHILHVGTHFTRLYQLIQKCRLKFSLFYARDNQEQCPHHTLV